MDTRNKNKVFLNFDESGKYKHHIMTAFECLYHAYWNWWHLSMSPFVPYVILTSKWQVEYDLLQTILLWDENNILKPQAWYQMNAVLIALRYI